MEPLAEIVYEYMLNLKTQSYFNGQRHCRGDIVNERRRPEYDITFRIVSALALYTWDYFLTFQMEVDLVWDSKWSFTKGLFLVQRYLPFVDVIFLMPYQSLGRDLSVGDCRRVYSTLGWMMMSGTILAELLLALRVWAFWNGPGGKWAAIILSLSFAVFWAPTYVYVHRFLESLQFSSLSFPGFVGCALMASNNSLFLCYITVVVWNTGTLIFMLIPGFRAYRATGTSSLFRVICHDGVSYYIYLVVLSSLNVLAIRTFPLGANYLFLSMERGLHSILASRVLLHIRNHVKNGVEVGSEMDVDAGLNHVDVGVSVYDIRSSVLLGQDERYGIERWFGFLTGSRMGKWLWRMRRQTGDSESGC